MEGTWTLEHSEGTRAMKVLKALRQLGHLCNLALEALYLEDSKPTICHTICHEELKFRKKLFDDKSLLNAIMMVVLLMVIIC